MKLLKNPLIVAILIAATFIFGLVSGKSKAYTYLDSTSVQSQLMLVGTTISIKGKSTAANDSNYCIVIAV
jgi:hypothetical protein